MVLSYSSMRERNLNCRMTIGDNKNAQKNFKSEERILSVFIMKK
jgi:hypothetical protein